MPERWFPVMWPYNSERSREFKRLGCPTVIAWSLVAAHEEQALRNHGGQTLERLAERGGLSPQELSAVLADADWEERPGVDDEKAVAYLRAAIEAEVFERGAAEERRRTHEKVCELRSWLESIGINALNMDGGMTEGEAFDLLRMVEATIAKLRALGLAQP